MIRDVDASAPVYLALGLAVIGLLLGAKDVTTQVNEFLNVRRRAARELATHNILGEC
jgi:hypothetical protein